MPSDERNLHSAAIERALVGLQPRPTPAGKVTEEDKRRVLRELVAEVEERTTETLRPMIVEGDRLARIVELCEEIIWQRANYEGGQVQENAETAADILALAHGEGGERVEKDSLQGALPDAPATPDLAELRRLLEDAINALPRSPHTAGEYLKEARALIPKDGAAGPDYNKLYHELLWEVVMIRQDESRHETARRIIKEHEAPQITDQRRTVNDENQT